MIHEYYYIYAFAAFCAVVPFFFALALRTQEELKLFIFMAVIILIFIISYTIYLRSDSEAGAASFFAFKAIISFIPAILGSIIGAIVQSIRIREYGLKPLRTLILIIGSLVAISFLFFPMLVRNKPDLVCEPYGNDYKLKAILDMKRNESNYASSAAERKFLMSLNTYTNPIENITDDTKYRAWSVYKGNKISEYRVSFHHDVGDGREYSVYCEFKCGKLLINCTVLGP